MEKIKVLAICTSPRKGKNTEQLLLKTLEGCQSVGAEIELFIVANKDLNPCKGCSACQIAKKMPDR